MNSTRKKRGRKASKAADKPSAAGKGASKKTATKKQASKKAATKKPATKKKPSQKRASSANASKRRSFPERVDDYLLLMRVDKPVGILLLMWPTLWALWFAAEGIPDFDLLAIFVLGCFLMRSAGCVINDFADRKIDGHVKRTKQRPLVNGRVQPREALLLFVFLCVSSFALVCLTNVLTISLSVVGVLLAAGYPFAKRYTYIPQAVLGAAFAWSIPMAWAAQRNEISESIFLLYLAVLLWTVAYDTFYAMVDRDDDIKIGVKSTAILFGEADRFVTAVLQGMVVFVLLMVGQKFSMQLYYYGGIGLAAALFGYQQFLIRNRDRDLCFKAFINNQWVGFVVFVGIAVDFYMRAEISAIS